jgi:hypothetical protein
MFFLVKLVNTFTLDHMYPITGNTEVQWIVRSLLYYDEVLESCFWQLLEKITGFDVASCEDSINVCLAMPEELSRSRDTNTFLKRTWSRSANSHCPAAVQKKKKYRTSTWLLNAHPPWRPRHLLSSSRRWFREAAPHAPTGAAH